MIELRVVNGILPGYDHPEPPSQAQVEAALGTIRFWGGKECKRCVVVYSGAPPDGKWVFTLHVIRHTI